MGDVIQGLFANPLVLGGVVLLLVTLVALLVFARRRATTQNDDWIIDDHLAAGRYMQAASLAQKGGKLRQAIDYFQRAQNPGRAAQVAARMGDMRRAGELYELADDLERAAYHFRQAGMPNKAEELESQIQPAPQSMPSVSRRPIPSAVPKVSVPDAWADADAPDAPTRFRLEQAKGKGDLAQQTRLQELAAEAADELLQAGKHREAAEVYRDAGLSEEAIHLYANVLGAPGEAAPLLAAQGNHERAAEMYDRAGQNERAAELWVGLATSASDPLAYADRILTASLPAAVQFLDQLAAARPLTPGTAEVHYRYARALEQDGQTERAIVVYVSVSEVARGYKDVADRLATLRAPLERRSLTPPPDAGRFPSLPASMFPGVPSPLPALGVEQISAIARQAAEHAIAQAARSRSFQPLALEPALNDRSPSEARVARGKTSRVSVGLVETPISIEDLVDSPVRQARDGPSIASLLEWTKGDVCALQNIEVYYRLGLAYLAAGQWGEARTAFLAVDEVSPGYRDAGKRAQDIQKWTRAVETKLAQSSSSSVAGASETPNAPDRYKIVGELGRGGMAVVYRAVDQVLGRDIALKFITEEYAGQKEFIDLFQREARSAARLNHPNIVTIYDFGVLDRRPFLSMEYVNGLTAEQMIDQRGRLTVVEALVIAREVLRALHYAHKEHIIHRDIKPSNMMQLTTGAIKLMDFGLAKSVEFDARSSIIAGSPAYMAPEQAYGGAADHRADLFAVGASLYEMLVGRVPYDSSDRVAPPPALRSIEPALPEALEQIVSKALSFDPNRRFQSAKEFGLPLKRILDAVEAFHLPTPGRVAERAGALHTPLKSRAPNASPLPAPDVPKAKAPAVYAPTKISGN